METKDKQAIEQLIRTYFNSLNDSSVEDAVAQYTDNGIFMPKEAPTSSGTEQLKAAYGHVFGALDFINMSYTLDEVTVVENMAIVRTSSLGDLKIIAKNEILKGVTHRELFVLQKVRSEWKIARYMFNTTAPVAVAH